MTIKLAILKETAAGERRVAMTPPVMEKLISNTSQDPPDCKVAVVKGAGEAAGVADGAYQQADHADTNKSACKDAALILCVQLPQQDILAAMPDNAVLIGLLAPHRHPERIAQLAQRGITSFSMELVPRISRAQSMDALSSQAAVAGYRSALMAAQYLPRFLPMLTTAAGTIRPAQVLVIGAGVAGLQAIATAKRLGAKVEAFDVRSAAREQVESLGATFIDTGVQADAVGGYARELTDDEKKQQQQALAEHIARADAVIATAAVPGRPAPKIITRAMVDAMKPASVIIDLAAESGGNCELSTPGETLLHGHVTIVAPLNVPSQLAEHASDMYARNLLNFITPLMDDGKLHIDWDDEIYKNSVLTHAGEIEHEPTRAQAKKE